MVIENGISGLGGLLDLATIPIKTAFRRDRKLHGQPAPGVARKISLMEEAGGVSVEKLLLCGEPEAVQSMAIEMFQSGRKLVLAGVPLEQVAAWCFQHNYRWRFHHDSSAQSAFILEPGKPPAPESPEGKR